MGHDSKYASHRFIPEQPRGLLHRAFSVFLFSADDKLLLQQRASTKITFPSLWTNTCCSHPLYGYEPTEVDTDEDIAAGTVPGAKRAAVRKLQHELGIAPEQVPISKFKYLTRLHYCAADEFAEDQAMSGGPWGEHEMDYILFIKPDADVTFQPNPEEIDDAKWVTREELREMMDPASFQNTSSSNATGYNSGGQNGDYSGGQTGGYRRRRRGANPSPSRLQNSVHQCLRGCSTASFFHILKGP